MKFLFNLTGVAVVINAFFGCLCILIAFLNRDRGDYTPLWIYGIFSVVAGIVMCASASMVEKKIQKSEAQAPTLQPKYRVLIAVGVALVVYLLFKPETSDTWASVAVPQPVDVSSYRRSDGTSVSEHKRAMPGDRAIAVNINRERSAAARNRIRDYEKERNQLLVICVLIVVAGFVWAGRPSQN